MKSKITKIQILMKGMAIILASMFVLTPISYATTSLDDGYLESTFLEKLLYGEIGSTAKEIEESLETRSTLYLKSETQIKALAEYVNNGNDCSRKEIIILEDIEFDSNDQWVPIGTEEHPFNGTFDGNSHAISGISYYSDETTDEELRIGLFGVVGENGVIKNIKIEKFYIDTTNNENSVVGNIAALNKGTIKNCTNTSNISGYRCVGGLVGNNWGTIQNCSNTANVVGDAFVGGIAGAHSSNIDNCINSGNISGKSKIGGIAGQNFDGIIKYTRNSGTITGEEEVGGIAGSGYGSESVDGYVYSEIKNAINTGYINADERAGGIVGYCYTSVVEYVQNSGEVRGSTVIGGIAGGARNSNIVSAINYGKIYGQVETAESEETTNCGGIIGYARECHISDIINTGNIDAGINAGGIVGNAVSTSIENAINKGKIGKDTTYGTCFGGIAGSLALSSTVSYSENKGTIIGEECVGGIVGETITDSINIRNCINNGVINSYKDVGGIVGSVRADIYVTDCINNGEIKLGINGNGGIIGRVYYTAPYTCTINNCINKEIKDVGTARGGILGSGITDSFPSGAAINIINCTNEDTNTADIGYGEGTIVGSGMANIDESSIGANLDESKIGANIDESTLGNVGNIQKPTPITQDFGNTNVTYTIFKNDEEIKFNEYFKVGDVIKVTAVLDSALVKSYIPLELITTELAPVLKLNDSIEMQIENIDIDLNNYTTTIVYTYTVEEMNDSIKSLNLYNEGEYYAVTKDGYTIESITSASTSIENLDIHVDSVAPQVNTTVYVENALETGRYTAGKETIILITTSERINGDYEELDVQVSFSKSGTGKYNYTKEENKVGHAKCMGSAINMDGTTTWVYSYQIQEGDEGNIQLSYTSGKITDIAGNETDLTTLEKEEKDLYADTTLPTVEIVCKEIKEKEKIDVTDITNADKLEYTFTWSEEVEEFKAEDITVNNGNKGELYDVIKNEDGTYSYTIEITPSIENGNVGDLQVIIEQDACKDLVAQGNVRTESIIRVDKKAAVLESLEAYVTSNIALNEDIDTVKQYYKTEEIITVVATFDENIVAENIPTLSLQFSESGNVKNSKVSGTVNGNKITYTYTIEEGNKGTLSVKGFTGVVSDAAGNETMVTKKPLDGNTIIADTIDPILNELKVTSTRIANNADKEITIEAVYSEEVFALITKEDGTKEIVNITKDNAPELELTFGGIPAKREEIDSVKYGETEGKEDKTKIVYTYKVKGQETEGDNGVLEISSFTQKENIPVCDIAGNTSNNVPNPKNENGVYADTTKPVVDNITANVENPSISNTGIYHKAGNEIKITVKFSEDVHAAKLWSRILVGFSEEEGVEPSNYKQVLDLNATTDLREYTYTIEEGDNGFLWVKVEEEHYADEAGNKNVAEELTEEGILRGVELKTVYADTTDPHINVHTDTEIKQDGQTITVLAKFNEKVYDLDGQALKNLEEKYAPILLYGFEGATEVLTAHAKDVTDNVITYEVTKDNTISGEFYCAYLKGNLYDRAGNEFFTSGLDTIAPVLESVVISSNSNYEYCKEGTEIYVTATFNEQISDKNINMNLEAKIENSQTTEIIKGEVSEVNPKQVIFKYTVKAGDTGEFKIIDVCGKINSQSTEEDNDYGYVQDLSGNQNNIYSFENEGVEVEGKEIADTTAPYITNIKAISNDKEIATYTKKDGEDVVVTVGRTSANIVEYIVTYNEEVPYKHLENLEKITITNGIITQRETIDKYSYKITVQTTIEGVQSLIINEGTVEDKAGNIDGFVRLDAVTVDFTKPTVRFISEYNGGTYVLPTNIDKVEIRPNVEISEDIDTIFYKWDDEKDYVKIENYSSSSDIAVPTKTFTEYGEHKLYIKVIDTAGNVSETSKTYTILNSYIEISADITEDTNQNVTVTVAFGEGLTDNRKVTFKAEDSGEIIELDAVGTNIDGTEYTIWTNGTIYAEATDRVGNKVYTEHTIYNIDKEAPIIEIDPYGDTYLIGTIDGTDKATINAVVKVDDANIKEVKYIYSNNKTLTDEEKAVMIKIDSYEEVTKTDAVEGKYYIHVHAVDTAGNETMYISNEFNVVKDTNGPEFEIYGNPEKWTSSDVILEVYCYDELSALTVNGKDILEDRNYTVTENGDYEVIATNIYGTSKNEVVKVTKIDKEGPEISKVENKGQEITITATDEKSGIKEYAITSTTEVPVEWSKSNVINTTKDGIFYVWAKDNVGNISRAEETIIIGKTEDSEIIFENLVTIQINGKKYVKVSPKFTTEELTNQINKNTLNGKKPEYTKLTEDNRLRTGSEITINGEITYTIVVSGDVNGDGKVTFLGDIVKINNYRIGLGELSDIELLAGDINSNGSINFIPDIVAMNNYRLGIINSL